MEISSVNGVKNSLNVTKQENNEINSANIEPKKDGNKKIAMALAALAATAAAGVGVAVAAKKGKINLPKLENSVKNAADDIGKVVKDTTDDAAKAAKGAADDVGKVVKDTADDAVKGAVDDVADVTIKQSKMPQGRNEIVEKCTQDIKELQNKLKNCKDPFRRAYIQRDIVFAQQTRWLNMNAARKGTLSPSDLALFHKHRFDLEEKARKITHDAFVQDNHHPEILKKIKQDNLYGHIIDSIKEGFLDEAGNATPKMNGLMKELSKSTGRNFYTPEEAIMYAAKEKLKAHPQFAIDELMYQLGEKLEKMRK